MSRVYALAVEENTNAADVDPGNSLLWRANPKRLEAEAIRDSLVMISGQLHPRPHSSPFALVPSIGDQGSSINMDRAGFKMDQFHARAVYAPILRHNVPAILDLFDFPDPNILLGKRDVTTSPVQALYLMNSEFVSDMSERAACKADAPWLWRSSGGRNLFVVFWSSAGLKRSGTRHGIPQRASRDR